MFGTFAGLGPHPTYGPSVGESAVEYKIGLRGYDGGIHNSPFAGSGAVKEPFMAPGAFHPFMFEKPRRRRINLLSCLQVLALPTLVFALTMYLFGFIVHNNSPHWCWFFVVFCVMLSCLFLFKAYTVYRRIRHERWTTPWYKLDDDDTWFLYLGLSTLLSCILGAIVGSIIFGMYTQSYYTLSLLHTYQNVDPVSEGKAYLDAGAVEFRNDTYVDITQALGYKDGTVYCVAPIKFGKDAVVNIDFWAVGTDCCTGFPGNFNCFDDRDDATARGGLRIVDDSDIAFYKLAQMQANGEFKDNAEYLLDGRLNTVDPIFVRWMADPVQKIRNKWRNATWTYGVCFAVFFVVECIMVSCLALQYWKSKLWG